MMTNEREGVEKGGLVLRKEERDLGTRTDIQQLSTIIVSQKRESSCPCKIGP